MLQVSERTSVFSNHKISIGLHVLAWAIIMLMPRYIVNTFGNGQMGFLRPLYANMFVYGLLFYLNFVFLVPYFYFEGNKKTYFLLSFLVLFAFCLLLWYLNEKVLFDMRRAHRIKDMTDTVRGDKAWLPPPIKELKLLNYVYTTILILGFSLGLKLIQKVSKDEKEKKDLEKEKLNSELAFLKNQISPHFFFNTLNNIYSLININTADAQNAVLKLSKLMRYMLYDSEKEGLPLSSEIDFLKYYVDLMKLRLSSKVKLTVQLPENYPNYYIPPLLFVSFIENAFKHAVSYRGDSFIDIKMEVDKERVLFRTNNSIGHNNQVYNSKHSGIGLANVKKRLNLLFPTTHKLDIIHDSEHFLVELTLFELAK